MQAEVFFLHHQGEQRGPYTAAQIQHLYRCGFIEDETMFWREGLEQWQPVTQLVYRRRKKNRIVGWMIAAGTALLLIVFIALFGSVTADAWREMTRGEYSAEDAWWRARGLVRESIGRDEQIHFDPISNATVKLTPPDDAVVTLSGQLTDAAGHTGPAQWRVRLQHDPTTYQWRPAPNKP